MGNAELSRVSRDERTHFVESRMGASTDARSAAPFPIPAHQTGRADFPHPAFRLASPLDSRTRIQLDISKPQDSEYPNTTSSLKWRVPCDCTGNSFFALRYSLL